MADAALDQWGDAARLPETLGALLDPARDLPAEVNFFPEKPQPWLLATISLPFAILFILGALIVGPLRFVLGVEMSSPEVLGSLAFSALLLLPAVILLIRWRRELDDHRQRKSGAWRRGVFLTPTHLLIHFGPDRVRAIARDAITEARITPPGPETPDATPHVAITWNKSNKTLHSLELEETLDIPPEELLARVESWLAAEPPASL